MRILISSFLILDRHSALKITWAPFQGDDTDRVLQAVKQNEDEVYLYQFYNILMFQLI